MVYSAHMIVLNSTKVGDSSLVVHTLSRERGRRSFITAVSRKTSMALLQPLSIIDAEIVENPKSDLWRLRSLRALHPLNGLRRDVRKSAMALFMSETLYRTVSEGVYEDGFYEWCEKSILTLDALQADFSNYHLRFLLEMAAALGFQPSSVSLAPFAGDCLHELEDLLGLSFTGFLLYPLSGQRRSAIADVLIRYIGYHTETSLNIRSLGVLRELFS